MQSIMIRTVYCLIMIAFSASWIHAATGDIESAAEKVARMSDQEARQALVEKLEVEATAAYPELTPDAEQALPITARFFLRTEEALSEMFSKSRRLVQQSVTDDRHWQAALDRIMEGKGFGHLAGTLTLVLLCIAIGIAAEMAVRRPVRQFSRRLVVPSSAGWMHFWNGVVSSALMEILYAAVYFLASMIVFVALFNKGDVRYTIASAFVLAFYYVRLIILCAQIFFSPNRQEIRLIPITNDNARFVFNWIISITLVTAILAGVSIILENLEVDPSLSQVTHSTIGLMISLLLAAMIWTGRKRVAQSLFRADSQLDSPVTTLGARLGTLWHVFAIVFVIGVGLVWQGNALIGDSGSALNLIISLFVLPIYFVVDHWMVRLINMALSNRTEKELKSSDSDDGSPEAQPIDGLETSTAGQSSHSSAVSYLPKLKVIARIVLLIFAFIVMLNLWDINLPMGQLLTSRVLSVIVIILLGLACWQFIKVKIDASMASEASDDMDEKEEGGAGGSRRGTLLVLLRKFIFAVLVVISGLTVLSSLGINIGPLIAGAGVLGLAIGFGAQTLVKDILSGGFFLIDDAFRVGDYIETGSTKGMVQHISLRSLRLRHPRGMVHTIPFSDINTVTNFSRDYIISKLDFRVRYDADVDKIRKIIKKKVNKVIEKNEELGPKLLSPIKSQGVRQMDDSAMVMRVKFKTIPGEQFVVRKEVFRLMQEAFQQEGIEFAHRNVTVYLPQDNEQQNGQLSPEAKEKIIRAGASAIAAEEAAKAEGGEREK